MRALAGVVVLAVATPAAADPGFVMIDRQDASSRAGAELSYVPLRGSSATLIRVELDGQYVGEAGVGGYVSLPGGFGSGNGNSADGIGALELGAMFARQRPDGAGIVVHAGLVLPTASQDGGALVELGSVARLPSFVQVIQHGVVIRAGVSPTFHSGRGFGRIDADLDVYTGCDGCSTRFAHFDGGIGYDLGNVALMAEVADLTVFGGGGSGSIDTAAVSVRGHNGRAQPYGGIVIPLDQDARSVAAIALTVGVDVTLR